MWRLFGRASDAARGQIRPMREPSIQAESIPPMFDIVGTDDAGRDVVLEWACPGIRSAFRRLDYLQPLYPGLALRLRRVA